jgi:DNA-binding transcriptional MerR regulator
MLLRAAMAYVSTSKALQTLGVSPDTLRRWADRGLIKMYRVTETGHRFYDVDDMIEREQQRLRAKRERLAQLSSANRNRT